MEKSWQWKYEPALQPVEQLELLASSSSPLPGAPNQHSNGDGGARYHPFGSHGSGSRGHEKMPQPVLQFTANRPFVEKRGILSFSPLSGAPILVQHDSKGLPNCRDVSNSVKLPVGGNSVAVSATENAVSSTFSNFLSRRTTQETQKKEHSGLLLSPNEMSTSDAYASLHDDLQAGNFNRFNLPRPAAVPLFPPDERMSSFFSSKGELCGTILTNARKPSITSSQSSMKLPLQVNSPSASLNGFPRVFCLGTSGKLLLSSNGLLGIVCSCHSLHMSVSKFCEHSGLCSANPGDVICMGNGETIAQWREHYQQKNGVRMPEDRCGWDWPEGLLATPASLNSTLNIFKLDTSSNFSYSVGSSGLFARSAHTLRNNALPKKPSSANSGIIDFACDVKQNNVRGGGELLHKELPASSGNNLADSWILQSSKFPDLVTSNSFTERPDYSSKTSRGDSKMNNSNCSFNSSASKTTPTLHKGTVFSKTEIARTGSMIDRDAASSNIELRLGQPNQQSWTAGHSVRSWNFDRPPNKGKGEFQKAIQSAICPSNTYTNSGQNQLNFDMHLDRMKKADVCPEVLILGSHVNRSAVTSPNLGCNPYMEANVQSAFSNNSVNDLSFLSLISQLSSSSTAKCSPNNIHQNDGYVSEKLMSVSDGALHKIIEKSHVARNASDFSYLQRESRSIISGLTENFGTLNAGSALKNCPRPFLDNPQEAAEIIGAEQSTRQISLPMLSGLIPPLQTPSWGLHPVNSTVTNGVPFMPKQEVTKASPYLLDRTMRSLSVQQIVELSQQQQRSISDGVNSSKELHGSNGKKLFSPNKSLEVVRENTAPDINVRGGNSEAQVRSHEHQSCIRNSSYSTTITGLERECCISNFSSVPLLSGSVGSQCRQPHGPSRKDQALPRFDQYEKTVSNDKSTGHPGSDKRISGNYRGPASGECEGGNCEPRSKYYSRVEATAYVAREIASRTLQLSERGELKDEHHIDVPSKAKRGADRNYLDRSSGLELCGTENSDSKLASNATKSPDKIVELAESLREQDMSNSNISSGCSGPAVTQVSVEANKIGSQEEVMQGGCMTSVVDQGSAIDDRCSLGDDASESEKSSSHYNASSCATSSRKELPCQFRNNQSCFSLLDEVKFLDSLTWKKGLKQNHDINGIHKEAKRDVNVGKSKRVVKFKMLNSLLSCTCLYVLHNGKTRRICNAEQCACPSNDVQTHCSPGKSSSTRRNSDHLGRVLESSVLLSHKRKLPEVVNDVEGADAGLEETREINFKGIENGQVGKKVRAKWCSDSYGESKMQEPSHVDAEKEELGDYNSEDCIMASARQIDTHFEKFWPLVDGLYGEVLSRNHDPALSKPAKIVSLGRILAAARKYTTPERWEHSRTPKDKLKRTLYGGNYSLQKGFSGFHREKGNGVCNPSKLRSSDAETNKLFSKEGKIHREECEEALAIGNDFNLRKKPKEVRLRSLDELMLLDEDSKAVRVSANTTKKRKRKIVKIPDEERAYVPKKVFKIAGEGRPYILRTCKAGGNKLSLLDGTANVQNDSFCSITESLASDENSSLLECSQCLRRVDQGVCEVPKNHWHCQPCKTTYKDSGPQQHEVKQMDKETFVGIYPHHDENFTRESRCADPSVVVDVERESTCARTEGYKGHKKDGFLHNLYGSQSGNVPQDQLNAWVHINGIKSFRLRGILQSSTQSDVESDCRGEYGRYKRRKAWKQLVLYKSGIHALGLYTSQFIRRGEMVVEYVGEIVGQRVADKREVEYQYGRRLQYRSACYFFRVDKVHIIDATRKGGIARFVNHSCMPNCVAKVISVKSKKKVVFFAERDIFPGEEITYDYHFNNEDEGKKIPCYCNAQKCKQYLN